MIPTAARLAALLLAAHPGALPWTLSARAQPAADAAQVAGFWDLAVEGTHRRCRLTLALDPAAIGRAVRHPAGCRRAVPLLAGVAGWTAPARDSLVLHDAMGQAALTFRPLGEDGALVARTEAGEVYRLERGERMRAALPPAPPPLGVPRETPVDPLTAPAPTTLPGVYHVDRYTEQDVCRVALVALPTIRQGTYEARLLEGCRDRGLAAFEPVSWRYEAGRLTLTARRGHEVSLISDRQGRWRRDPEIGATLVLRRAE